MKGRKNMLRTLMALLTVGAVGTAFAEPIDETAPPCQAEGVQRTVTNTDSGVVIEIASDDPQIVETIQERHANPPPGPAHGFGCHGRGGGFGRFRDVQRTVTDIDNGVTIELTSDDAEVVEKIQARAAEMPGEGHGGCGGCGPCQVDGAERAVTNTDTGVTITVTSDDPEVVEEIQAAVPGPNPHGHGLGRMDGRGGGGKGLGHGQGKGHGRAHGRRKGMGKGGGRHHRGMGMGPIEGVERTVTNTDSGVLIEISAEDPELVAKIQEWHSQNPEGRKHGRWGGRPDRT